MKAGDESANITPRPRYADPVRDLRGGLPNLFWLVYRYQHMFCLISGDEPEGYERNWECPRMMSPRPSGSHRLLLLLACTLVLAAAADARPLTGQGLPPQVQVDRFLVQADRHIRNEDYAAALEALDRVLVLQAEHGLELPDNFWVKQAQVAFGAGEFDQAVAGATRHLELADSDGEEYMTALELLDEAVAVGCAPGPDFLRATPEMVRQCITLGANLEAQDEYGSTVLQWAGYHPDSAVTGILIDAGFFPPPVRGRSGSERLRRRRPPATWRPWSLLPTSQVSSSLRQRT